MSQLSCFRRRQHRASNQNCLVIDENNDCYMDSALFFIHYYKICKFGSNWMSLNVGFHTCPTAANSTTPNINKVTEIGNKAKQLCREEAGDGNKCQVEEKYNKCLTKFNNLSRRVYRLANGTNFSYNLHITRSDECISPSEKCYDKEIKLARQAEKNCQDEEERKRAESLKSPWVCDHYSVKSCRNTYLNSIRSAVRPGNCD